MFLFYFLHFLGDEISCQIEPLFRKDKEDMRLILSRCPDLNVTHVSYLGFVGKDRPEYLGQSHRSQEIKEYLKDRGLTIEEFDEMRFQARQPLPPQLNEARPVSLNPSVSKTEEETAKHLAGKLIRTKSLKDRKLKTMLRTPEDVEIASHLIKMLQECVSHSDQKQSKEVQRQIEVSTSAVTDISRLQTSNQRENENYMKALIDVPKLIKEVKIANSNKKEEKESPMSVSDHFLRNAEIVRQSKAEDGIPHIRRVLSNETGGFVLEQKIGKLSPLQHLRNFTKNKKEISVEGVMIWFGDVGFPKSTKTNFQVSTFYHKTCMK